MSTDAATEEHADEQTDGGEDNGAGEGNAEDAAQKKAEERDKAQDRIRELEEGDIPDDLEGWPEDAAMYETFGSDDDAYGEGATAKLGPPDLERHPDGSVSIGGEKVENPDDYKGEPITGGVPTDD